MMGRKYMHILFGFSANQKDKESIAIAARSPLCAVATGTISRGSAQLWLSFHHGQACLRKVSGEQLGRKPIISEAHNLFSFI